ncbi:hypothetical protein [Clostridium aminobutyricum]|uniref:Uncharacterized protein n=1 Tax=Clostridium aminobutyricum TaxID=33953 RepID=A0A939IIE6_CLOAM|nr:hypothetical protein [Clostridium aminobutyricum]MBN7772991.1 hypothetical protein [Clostridium aminobutyricum]
MRIYIRDKNGRRLYIPVPTRLIANRISAHMVSFAIQKALKLEANPLGAADINRLFSELIRMKRKYRNFELVNVESAEGDLVIIKL